MTQEKPQEKEHAMNRTEHLVARARQGERAALEELVGSIRDLVYNLAIRMLGTPADAEDVTQEILIRVVTGLSNFRGESSFKTWVYRVASNHLLTTRKRLAEERTASFEAVAAHLDAGLAASLPPLEDQLFVREAKLRCTTRMVLSLDSDHRVVYVLGEILDLSAEEGATILEISEDAFRKRLSRARERMGEFMESRCGLVNESLPCRCAMQAANGVHVGYLTVESLRFSTHAVRKRAEDATAAKRLEAVEGWERAASVLRGHPNYAAPEKITEELKRLLASDTTGLVH